MRHDEGTFAGAGGVEIYWQSWTPAGTPRASVVIAHGGSEHSGRYGYVVERLVAAGFAVSALDHRGHGKSGGPRAVIDSFDRALEDIDTLVSRAGAPVFLLGHSVGGCFALAYALRRQAKLAGLVLSSPVAAIEAAPLPLRMIARTLSVVAPRTGVVPIDNDGISRDPDEVRRYAEDPLVFHGKLPARTVTVLVDAVGSFPARVGELHVPLLIVHGEADRIVPIAGSEMVAAGAGSEDLTFKRYPGAFHELFNEPLGERTQALDDLEAWLLARA
jgi:alpha-beta hydrolase superfamily lysophospholipase